MMDFKIFILESEKNNQDVRDTLGRIPKKHANLVKNYKFVFQPGNTMKNDKSHVGLIDDVKKTIILAAPWNYPREWVLLHEIAHAVWNKLIGEEKKKEWHVLCKSTKIDKSEKDNNEELFCHAYAAHYCNHKMKRYDYPKWMNFIDSL